jgi:hypothetical protein
MDDSLGLESLADTAADNVVFVYGRLVPYDVVRARIDPSVIMIPQEAFAQRTRLEEVEFHDDLRVISILCTFGANVGP